MVYQEVHCRITDLSGKTEKAQRDIYVGPSTVQEENEVGRYGLPTYNLWKCCIECL